MFYIDSKFSFIAQGNFSVRFLLCSNMISKDNIKRVIIIIQEYVTNEYLVDVFFDLSCFPLLLLWLLMLGGGKHTLNTVVNFKKKGKKPIHPFKWM